MLALLTGILWSAWTVADKAAPVPQLPGVYSCRVCRMRFSSKKSVKEHISLHFIRQGCPDPNGTDSTGYSFSCNLSRAENYTCESFQARIRPPGGKCSECGRIVSHIRLHQYIHTGERPYGCRECPQRFVTSSNLKVHETVHKRKKYECSKCSKVFRAVKSLRMHLQAVHTKSKFVCTYNNCSKSYRYQPGLSVAVGFES
ncbi:hypothetical protein AAMO2058_000551800 [Amorphochlora amoebiformis]